MNLKILIIGAVYIATVNMLTVERRRRRRRRWFSGGGCGQLQYTKRLSVCLVQHACTHALRGYLQQDKQQKQLGSQVNSSVYNARRW